MVFNKLSFLSLNIKKIFSFLRNFRKNRKAVIQLNPDYCSALAGSMKDTKLSFIEKSKILKELRNILPIDVIINPDSVLLSKLIQIDSITQIMCRISSYKLLGDKGDVFIMAL